MRSLKPKLIAQTIHDKFGITERGIRWVEASPSCP
jgi:hypothetical protein